MALSSETVRELEKEFGLTPINEFEARLDQHVEKIQQETLNIHNYTPGNDKLYNIKQAAERLGLSRTVIKRAVMDGEIKTTKLGKRLYIPFSEIKRMLQITN